MDIKAIVEQAIYEMHVYWVELQLRKMQAGEVECLKQECNIQGDIRYLARHIWQEYQKKEKKNV